MKALVTMVALSASLFTPAAHALFSDDEARRAILDLRAQIASQQATISTLQKQNEQLSQQLQQANRAQLDLVNQLEILRRDNAGLRGNFEVLQKELADTQKRQRDLYGDTDARLKKLEPQKVTVDGKEAEISQDEARQYNTALEIFRNSKFPEAALAFGNFLRQYPKSAYAALAQFWQGSAHYAGRDFKAAILVLQDFVRVYPEHPRAPDALFNLGNSLVELNDKKNARLSFQELIKRYPNTPAAQNARERLADLK
jgi:tol-pal system protein YbgF